jgi:peptidoglycan/LPS O-acetylase OafA/YrhL
MSPFNSNNRENNFNFLRLLFASLVVLSHSFELLDGNRGREPLSRVFGTISFGEFAVDGFFLLSGYLIVQSWAIEPKPLQYLLKRIVRIYPGFIAASLICVLVIAPLGAIRGVYFSQFTVLDFVGEMLRLKVPTTPPFTFSRSGESINGSMWSINIEFQCYIAVLGLGLLGFVRNRLRWASIFACLVLLFIAMKICMVHGIKPEFFGRYPLNNFGNYLLVRLGMLFLAGGTFYLFRERIRLDARSAVFCGGLLLVGLCSQIVAEVAMAIVGGYLLFFIAFTPVAALNVFKHLPDVSYGLYLYAWPVQLLVIWQLSNASPWLVFIVSIIISTGLGLASWFLIEKPSLKLLRG